MSCSEENKICPSQNLYTYKSENKSELDNRKLIDRAQNAPLLNKHYILIFQKVIIFGMLQDIILTPL